MRKFSIACLLSLPLLTACAATPRLPSFVKERPLDSVDLNYPNIEVTFLATEKTYKSEDSFPPPKTLDCSRLKLKSDAFEDAIEAGALIVKIKTPGQVTRPLRDEEGKIIRDQKGKVITETIGIKDTYGGVLALCNVSDFAQGPDSRSYRIRGLDDYLVKGKDGLVSVVGAVLSYRNKSELPKELIDSKTGAPTISFTPYSWMFWLSDRSTTFTNYEAEVERRRAQRKK